MRLRFFSALFIVALFLSAPVSHASSASTHGCAPPIPPSVPGSPVPPPAIPGSLRINEVLSMPGSTWNCSESGKTFSLSDDSWVELYNPQSQPYNLYAAHASFVYLPLGAVIAPHGYLVLFPSVFSGTLSIKATLRLNIAGVTIDQVNVPSLPTDQSYARIPDGSNFWQITNTPTIDSSNMASQVTPVASSTNQGSGGNGSGGNSNTTSTPAPGTGTQPAWSNLQLPMQVTATSSTNSNPATFTISPTPSAPVSNGWDTPHRILLTVLATALVLMLFWCWRLFRKFFST